MVRVSDATGILAKRSTWQESGPIALAHRIGAGTFVDFPDGFPSTSQLSETEDARCVDELVKTVKDTN